MNTSNEEIVQFSRMFYNKIHKDSKRACARERERDRVCVCLYQFISNVCECEVNIEREQKVVKSRTYGHFIFKHEIHKHIAEQIPFWR